MSLCVANDGLNVMFDLASFSSPFLCCSYELVQALRSKVEYAIGNLIDGKVERNILGEGGGWEEQERVTQIAQEIIHSKQ